MKYIYLALAALLLLCLFHMPYGFYTLVRFVAMIVFVIIAYKYGAEEKMGVAIVAGALALLFQPLIKITLGRVVWNVVDVIAAIALIALFIYELKNKKNE